jgi:hypothetical protein
METYVKSSKARRGSYLDLEVQGASGIDARFLNQK